MPASARHIRLKLVAESQSAVRAVLNATLEYGRIGKRQKPIDVRSLSALCFALIKGDIYLCLLYIIFGLKTTPLDAPLFMGYYRLLYFAKEQVYEPV